MPSALESALSELIFGAELALEDEAGIRAWLARHAVSEEDAQALAEQGKERLLLYRSLVRGTLEGALTDSIPRTLARLGPLYPEYFDAFLRERGPRSHYLRDTTPEFLDYCAPLWSADPRIPDYLIELGRHEALHIQIAAAPPRAKDPEPAPLDLESGLAFHESARLVRYGHAVHLLPDDVEDRSEPEPKETHLFVYRDEEHMVRYLALTPLAASILGKLLAGESLKGSLISAATLHGASLDEELFRATARLLADLSERRALLGPCALRSTSQPEGV